MAITYDSTLNKETINVVGGKDTGTAISGTTMSLNDTGKTWTTNAYAGRKVWIYGGTGSGQIRRIDGNTATQIVPTVAFATAPDATSQYLVMFNYADLYQASLAGGWGRATNQGKQYRFTCNIVVGDGST